MIRVALIGTGGMAGQHVRYFRELRGVRLVAACDVQAERAREFATRHGIPRHGADYREFLRDPGVDAVSNITPDALHAPISIAALRAGKHVLCEKPLALDHAEARRMVAAARRAGRVAMVQFTYRSCPAWSAARRLAASGRLGRLVHFEASYLQSWLTSRAWGDWRTSPAWLWRLDSSRGSGGVLGDVGVHLLDFVTSIAGDLANVNCRLKTFTAVKGARRGGYTLDANDSALIHAELAGGATGVIHASRFATGHLNRVFLRLHGTEGALEVDLDRPSEMRVCLGRAIHPAQWRTVACPPAPTVFARFVRSIRTGRAEEPDFARGATVQRVLDACLRSARTGRTVSL